MVSNRILTLLGRRSSNQQNPRLTWPDEIRETTIILKPFPPPFIPTGDSRAESVGFVRSTAGQRRLELDKETVRLGMVAGSESVAELDEVLLGSAELAGADSAAEDDDGEDEAEDGDLEMAESSLDFSQPLLSQAPFDHLRGNLEELNQRNGNGNPRRRVLLRVERWKGEDEKAIVVVLCVIMEHSCTLSVRTVKLVRIF